MRTQPKNCKNHASILNSSKILNCFVCYRNNRIVSIVFILIMYLCTVCMYSMYIQLAPVNLSYSPFFYTDHYGIVGEEVTQDLTIVSGQ